MCIRKRLGILDNGAGDGIRTHDFLLGLEKVKYPDYNTRDGFNLAGESRSGTIDKG